MRHSTYLRKSGQFTRTATISTAEIAKGLYRHVDTDFVSVLETVRDGLCGRVNADIHPFNSMYFDSFE